jgi:hypothetical protein
LLAHCERTLLRRPGEPGSHSPTHRPPSTSLSGFHQSSGGVCCKRRWRRDGGRGSAAEEGGPLNDGRFYACSAPLSQTAFYLCSYRDSFGRIWIPLPWRRSPGARRDVRPLQRLAQLVRSCGLNAALLTGPWQRFLADGSMPQNVTVSEANTHKAASVNAAAGVGIHSHPPAVTVLLRRYPGVAAAICRYQTGVPGGQAGSRWQFQ